MDTHKFAQSLRYHAAEQRSEDDDFQKHAGGLRTKFSNLDIKLAHVERTDFVNYIDLIRVEQGIETALHELNRYRERGLLPALFALAILQITKRGGDFSRSETLLKSASEEFPLDDYVLQQYLQSTLANGNLKQLFTSLDQVVLRDLHRMNPVNRCRYAELAASAGSWNHVSQLLSGMDPVDSMSRSAALLNARADLGMSFEAKAAPDFPAYLINLVEDYRKWDLARKLFERMCIPVMRHDAVNGKALSQYVEDATLAPNVSRVEFGSGAVACALSHIAVWEKVADAEDAYALVLEDDGVPYSWRDVPQLVSAAGDFDVLYVNERMSAVHRGEADLGLSDIWDVLGSMSDARQGWGTDGYILSQRGAEKLLHAVSIDRIRGHIDGQLGAYGLKANLSPQSRAQRTGASLRRSMQSNVSIKSVCLNFPLITQLNFGYSSILAVS